MRRAAVWSWIAIALSLCACRLGPGKFPNPQWEPEVEETRLVPSPATFEGAGFELTLTRVTWICTTTFVLTRIPDRSEFDLVLEGYTPYLGSEAPIHEIRELPVKVLDAAGNEFSMRVDQRLHARGPVANERLGLRAQYALHTNEARPAAVVIGGKRITLVE